MELLGSGPKFPFTTSERGGIAQSADEDRIRESIRIILATAKGERVMRPEFGCDLAEMVFSVINTTTLTMIRSAVHDALTRWEPRIDLLDVDVRTDDVDNGVLSISVGYRIRRTNTEHNLVYPFYLNAGQ